MTGLYRTEFPDFGELDVTLPAGMIDLSLNTDVMPLFCFPERPDGIVVMVWIDYADPAKSKCLEDVEHYRFHCITYKDSDEYGEACEELLTGNWAEAVAWLEARRTQSFPPPPQGPQP